MRKLEQPTEAGCTELSEQDFSSFVIKTITDNPAAVYVEDDNVWNEQVDNPISLE